MPKKGVPLTDEEKRKIAALVDKLKNPTPGNIARRIGRPVPTVKWHMLTNGMYHKAPERAPCEYDRVRNGVTSRIYPWQECHDEFIQAKRTEGLSCAKVAAAVTAAFGIERKGHSVRVRLVLLAAAPDAST